MPSDVPVDALRAIEALLELDPPTSKWVQLASVEEGVARVRTVVLHGVPEGRLAIATDALSRKIAGLRREPRAEVCLLSREKQVQIRLLARFTIVDAALASFDATWAARRRDLWRAMPPREKGYYVSPPAGLPFEGFPATAFQGEALDPEPVPRFVLLSGELEGVDVLDVTRVPHDRHEWRREPGGWTKRRLTP